MKDRERYYLVREPAVPEVLLKVVEAKHMLETGKAETIQSAVDAQGISRSSFYKYKDDIFPFHENVHGKTITLSIQLEDKPGLLSGLLGIIAQYRANILTIHQAIPVNGLAVITLSIDILPTTGDFSAMAGAMEGLSGVRSIRILGRE
jgi:chorismate mutase